ncbi:hypothetical protein RJ640_022780, partial [Escallonia rubra]
HESKFIQQIVIEVFSKLDHPVSNFEENLVGIDSRVDEVKLLLELGTKDVRFIGIWGMGGIGKTTVTSALFDNIHHQFESAIFFHKVREKSKKCGLEKLQEIMISKILSKRDVKVHSIPHGVQWISRFVCQKKALVILDGVDSMVQEKRLAGNRDWFGKGSRVIITTRDKKILADTNVAKIHRVGLLSVTESVKLFNLNAFKQTDRPKEFEELSGRIVKYVGGLLLALKVFGSFLYGRDIEMWRRAVDRLKDIPEDKIIEKLRVSFDHGLKAVEQEMFHDIACLFKGEKIDYAERVVDSFDFYPSIGIPVLIKRSLIVISEGKLQMHDLIQEMRWHSVRQVHPREPGKCSRLWDPEEVCDVLTENTGTKKVEGIQLGLQKPTDVHFSSNPLRNMYKLRLLKFCNVYLCEDVEYLPNQLRWLRWHQYPSKSLPARATRGDSPKVRRNRVSVSYGGRTLVDKLKFVDLSHSQKLSRTPDFEDIPNLQSLVLEHCISLVEVHQSIAFHKNLVVLNLKGCINLRSLSDKIQFESLEVLVLSDGIILDKFPDIQGDMHSLSELFLDGTAIKVLPSTIEYLRNLVLVDLTRCRCLTSMPRSICSLRTLKLLRLLDCSKLEKLPKDLQNLELLEELHADRTAIVFLPRSIGFLSGCEDTIVTQSWSLPFVLPTVSGWYARLPGLQEPANFGTKFETGIYEEQVKSGYRLLLHPFALRFFEHYRMAPGQLVPNGWRKLSGLIYLVQTSGYKPDATDFMRVFFKICFVKGVANCPGWYYIHSRQRLLKGGPKSNKGWHSRYFFVGRLDKGELPFDKVWNPFCKDFESPGKPTPDMLTKHILSHIKRRGGLCIDEPLSEQQLEWAKIIPPKPIPAGLSIRPPPIAVHSVSSAETVPCFTEIIDFHLLSMFIPVLISFFVAEMASGSRKSPQAGFLGVLQKAKGKRKEKQPSVELPPTPKRTRVTPAERSPRILEQVSIEDNPIFRRMWTLRRDDLGMPDSQISEQHLRHGILPRDKEVFQTQTHETFACSFAQAVYMMYASGSEMLSRFEMAREVAAAEAQQTREAVKEAQEASHRVEELSKKEEDHLAHIATQEKRLERVKRKAAEEVAKARDQGIHDFLDGNAGDEWLKKRTEDGLEIYELGFVKAKEMIGERFPDIPMGDFVLPAVGSPSGETVMPPEAGDVEASRLPGEGPSGDAPEP